MKRLRPRRSTVILIRQLLIFVIVLINTLEAVKFEHDSFNNTNLSDVRFVYQDDWYVGQNASFSDGGLWLTPDPRDVSTTKYSDIGKFVYIDPIQFMNKQGDFPHTVASFNTSFSFQIITTAPYNYCGSGMAFFISSFDKAPRNSDGRYLGLFNPDASSISSNFFAVEFDTRISSNLKDPSASHIGVDINSLISLNTTDTSPSSGSPFYPELYLYMNYTFTAWIDYNSSTNLIQIWMTNSFMSSQHRPPQPCLQLSYNLSSVFQEFMYVGFSATNQAGEDSMEGHVVNSWSFYIEDLSASENPGPSKLLLPLAIILPILFVLTIIGISFLFISKTIRLRKDATSFTLPLRTPANVIQLGSGCPTLPRYSYKELKRSTHGFTDQNKVGEGGFSSVYKATLADGSIVAIKRLKEGVQREAEFSSEMNIISSIRHRNLLQLRGWCYEKGEAMLVYNYMSNGSLDNYLYGKKRGLLESEQRLRILTGVACALEYLHSGLGECVLHRDVKAANVLLTESFEPMLGDFGLARLIGHDEGAVTMTAAGTPGYVAPEVVYTGKATDKADVYSFGILALELACGRPAMDRSSSMQMDEGRVADYVWILHQRDQLVEALDPYMRMGMPSSDEIQWRCVLHVALMCTNPSPESRPTMRQVSQALQGDTMLLKQPLPPTRPLYPTSPAASSVGTTWSLIVSPSEAGAPRARSPSE